MRRILISLATSALVVLAALLPTAGTSAATSVAMPTRDTPVATKATLAANHTVTFVNHTGRKVWIGSAVNADGSRQFAKLPILEPGQSASVTIPENADPGHWRGKFFARLGCTGTSGSTFHCEVGDCGKFADRCELGEQPVSLAEFNFDTRDTLAPWYNVSYVNAFSNPITIAPDNPAGGGGCGTQGCTQNLLPFCPAANLTRWSDGTPMLCTNPNRDVRTPYSNAIASRCPKAYAYSKQDQEPGNQVMQNCGKCSGFTVTFNAGS
ncbi:thaumatin family protein [Streptomyces sp. DASNCL29]|uniref:thaumatin family protein n=1 Tax=Streptomyces sp. DASNCL29 TaxID=2583819 RepID=UPI00110F6F92|nr:thaumatin family protein [Streptomyces sp. DASNCL29]TMU99400.1 Thaumatin pathogenesis-like protein [Streptomyces sp. DASNCL29]